MATLRLRAARLRLAPLATMPLLPLLLLLLPLLLLLLVHPAHAVAFGSCCAAPDNANVRLFPLLARLRNGAVGFVFGQHPAKARDRPAVPGALPSKYANQLVLRFNLTTPDQEAALSAAAARLFLDVWAFTDEYVDVRLHADEVEPLLGLLPDPLPWSHSTLISDLAAAVHGSLPPHGSRETAEADGASWAPSMLLGPRDNLFFHDYQSLPVIVRWMRLLEAMFPSFVKYITVGKSFEGRDMAALRVGVPHLSGPDSPRKTIVVTGGLHAREWISTSTVNYLAWSFITSFGKERMVTKLLADYDLVFVPAVNPDGVEYTWQVDRLWRKSRQQTKMRLCRGLDLDHAFGYGWDGSQSQRDPCSESYGGEEPFEAVEASQLATWAHNETLNSNVQFVALVDLHSYSQQVLFPFSFSCSMDPPNLENLQEVAAGIAKAVCISNGESYSVTSACEGAVAVHEPRRARPWPRVESGGGSAMDWFYHEMWARFSYQIKLRDTGSYGFLLPRDQIVPTGEEMFNAIKYFGDYLLGNNGIEGSRATKADGGVDGLAPGESEDYKASGQELRRRRMRTLRTGAPTVTAWASRAKHRIRQVMDSN